MSKAFISYNRDSQDIARNLVEDVKNLGYTVWFDRELSGGQAWWDRILAIIRDCDVFVFVLDPNGLNSVACRREFGYASALGKPVLPVLVADGVSTNLLPPELSRLQVIDYRKQDRQSAISLARALAGLPPAQPIPDPLPPPPEIPVSYLGGLRRKIEMSPTLTYDEQSALVLDLRRGLRDSKTAADSRILLEGLRKRRDLFAAMAEEIDELLGSPTPATPLPRPNPAPVSHPIAPVPKVTPPKRWPGVLAGLTIGAAVGAATALFSGSNNDLEFSAIFVGIAGAIAGRICRARMRVGLIALAGFAVGVGLWGSVDSGPYRLFRAIICGGSLGAISGAIIGRIVQKRSHWP
jgi:hypothetical protein